MTTTSADVEMSSFSYTLAAVWLKIGASEAATTCMHACGFCSRVVDMCIVALQTSGLLGSLQDSNLVKEVGILSQTLMSTPDLQPRGCMNLLLLKCRSIVWQCEWMQYPTPRLCGMYCPSLKTSTREIRKILPQAHA